MTDLERARGLIQYWKDCEQYVGQHMSLSTNFETFVPLITAALAAARREGRDTVAAATDRVIARERAAAYDRGAEEMRERAAQFHRDQGVMREQCGDDVTAQLHWNCAYVIGRLPLTLEEPVRDE